MSRLSIVELANRGGIRMYLLLIRTGAVGLAVVVATVTVVAGIGNQPPACTGKVLEFPGAAANCGQGSNCPPKENNECVGEYIWIDPNPPTQYRCTTVGAVAASNCIDWMTSEQCGVVTGCKPNPFAPSTCWTDSNPIRLVFFNQAGTGGNCTVIGD